MRVRQITTCDEGATNPKRSRQGVTLALRWGDVAHPYGPGNWFAPPYFAKVLRFWLYPVVPFVVLWAWCYVLGVLLGTFGAWGLLGLPLLLLNPGAWVSWCLGNWRGYAGAKIWGAEPTDTPGAPGVEHWLKAGDVSPGSMAIQFSIRLSIRD